jgi:hypothetical protein
MTCPNTLAVGVARIDGAVGVGSLVTSSSSGFDSGGGQRIVLQPAKAAAELYMLLARDILIAKQQNTVIEKRLVDFTEGSFAHRRRHVYVAYFRAERIRQFA